MSLPVKLKDLIEGLAFQSDERPAYLHTTTGEVVCTTADELRAVEDEAPHDDDLSECQIEARGIAKAILETEDYLPLPTKYDIHDYRIMERFCLSIEDNEMQDDLCNAIRGKKAFKRFKEQIHWQGIAEEWYQYREAALRKIAIQWCKENGISHTP